MMNPVLLRILQLLILVLIQALLLFGCAWNPGWIEGWLYIGLYFLCLLLASILMLPRHKEVIAERSRGTKGGKTWDILLTRLIAIPSLGILMVAGLDQHFNWKPDFGLGILFVGIIFFLLGYFIVIWAMNKNRFFSSVVRIQKERRHSTITDGPYHYLRHPGYFGMIITALGSAFLLRSVWALIPFGIYAILVIVRTALEDKALQAELPGDKKYQRLTRYRLLPGIW